MKSIIFSTGLRYAALLLLVTDLSGGPPAFADQTSDTATENNEPETIIVTRAQARRVARDGAHQHHRLHRRDAQGLQHPVLRRLRHQDTQPVVHLRRGTDRHRGCAHASPSAASPARTCSAPPAPPASTSTTRRCPARSTRASSTSPTSRSSKVRRARSIGESSLGGNVKLVTSQPDLNRSGVGYMVDAGMTSGGGSADAGGNFIGNVVLVPGTAALRVVLFANHDAGYLTRTYPTDPASPGGGDPFLNVPRTSSGDQGAVSTGGGSAGAAGERHRQLRYQAARHVPGLQGPRLSRPPSRRCRSSPPSTPSTAPSTRSRTRPIRWTMPSLDLKYSGTGWSVVWANSYFYRHTQDVEDSSYGTQQVLSGPLLSRERAAGAALPVGRTALSRPVFERGAPVVRPDPQLQRHVRPVLLQHALALHDSADARRGLISRPPPPANSADRA